LCGYTVRNLFLRQGIFVTNGNDILPVGVIYGSDSGGKSNLLAALGCVITLVTEPVYEVGNMIMGAIPTPQELEATFIR
jgi:AAA15 family ATPase/GTPase